MFLEVHFLHYIARRFNCLYEYVSTLLTQIEACQTSLLKAPDINALNINDNSTHAN